VEMRGVEPLSESPLPKASTSVVAALNLAIPVSQQQDIANQRSAEPRSRSG